MAALPGIVTAIVRLLGALGVTWVGFKLERSGAIDNAARAVSGVTGTAATITTTVDHSTSVLARIDPTVMVLGAVGLGILLVFRR